MEIIIERAALLRVLSHAQQIVSKRNTIAILNNVMLQAKSGELSVAATDQDMEIIETVPAEVSRFGATTVPAHTLFDIVRKLPDGSQVGISAPESEGHATIKAGRSHFRLACLPASDYPAFSNTDLPHGFSIQAVGLRSLIDRTSFAVSTEETRYYLNGIYLHAPFIRAKDQHVLRGVATDGHRLALADLSLPAGALGIPGVIIPRATVAYIRKLIEDVPDNVSVSLSESRISFTVGTAVVTSKIIDGTFPDYERVIPGGNDKVLEVDTALLSAAVSRVATIVTDKSRAVRLEMSRGILALSAISPEAGSASEDVDAAYTAGPLEIGFNSSYLLENLRQIEGGRVRLELADAASPCIIREIEDDSVLYVLMPMRV